MDYSKNKRALLVFTKKGPHTEAPSFLISKPVYAVFNRGPPLCSGFSPGSGKSVSASFSIGS